MTYVRNLMHTPEGVIFLLGVAGLVVSAVGMLLS